MAIDDNDWQHDPRQRSLDANAIKQLLDIPYDSVDKTLKRLLPQLEMLTFGENDVRISELPSVQSLRENRRFTDEEWDEVLDALDMWRRVQRYLFAINGPGIDQLRREHKSFKNVNELADDLTELNRSLFAVERAEKERQRKGEPAYQRPSEEDVQADDLQPGARSAQRSPIDRNADLADVVERGQVSGEAESRLGVEQEPLPEEVRGGPQESRELVRRGAVPPGAEDRATAASSGARTEGPEEGLSSLSSARARRPREPIQTPRFDSTTAQGAAGGARQGTETQAPQRGERVNDPKLVHLQYAREVRHLALEGVNEESAENNVRGYVRSTLRARFRSTSSAEARVMDARTLLEYELARPGTSEARAALARRAVEVIDEEFERARDAQAAKRARRDAPTRIDRSISALNRGARRGAAAAHAGLDARGERKSVERQRRDEAFINSAAVNSPESQRVFDTLARLRVKGPDGVQVPRWSEAQIRLLKVAVGKQGEFNRQWWRPRPYRPTRDEVWALNRAQHDMAREDAWANDQEKARLTDEESEALRRAVSSGALDLAVAKDYAAARGGFFPFAFDPLYRLQLRERVRPVLQAIWEKQRRERRAERRGRINEVIAQGARRGIARAQRREEAVAELRQNIREDMRGAMGRAVNAAVDALRRRRTGATPERKTRSAATLGAKQSPYNLPSDKTTPLSREEWAYVLVEATKGAYRDTVTQADLDTYFAMWERSGNRGVPQSPNEREAASKLNPILFRGTRGRR
jgi:hypothetical protein